ncbi:MAG: hypothetical protein RIS64_4214 [Bacteroidota bacterium]|jgi:hypothetical protein
MKKLFFILLVPLLFLLAQCRKEPLSDTTSVEGTVMEFGTKKPMPNVLVYVRKLVSSSGWTETWILQDSTHTDLNGRYQIAFKPENATYQVMLRRPALYAGASSGKLLGSGKKELQDFILDPPGWLKIRVQNVNPVNQKDSLIIGWGVDRTFVGDRVDTIFQTYSYFDANRYIVLYPYVIKNGIGQQRKDSIYCAAHDTAFIHIKY